MNIPKSLISFIRIPIVNMQKSLHHLILAERRGITKMFAQQYRSFLTDKLPYKFTSLCIGLLQSSFLIKNYICVEIFFIKCIALTVSPPKSPSRFSHLSQLSNSMPFLSLSHWNKNQRNWQIRTTTKKKHKKNTVILF